VILLFHGLWRSGSWSYTYYELFIDSVIFIECVQSVCPRFTASGVGVGGPTQTHIVGAFANLKNKLEKLTFKDARQLNAV